MTLKIRPPDMDRLHAGFTGQTTIQLKDFGMDGVIGDAPIKLAVQAEGVRQ